MLSTCNDEQIYERSKPICLILRETSDYFQKLLMKLNNWTSFILAECEIYNDFCSERMAHVYMCICLIRNLFICFLYTLY